MIEDLLLSLLVNVIVFYAGYRWGMHQAIIRLITNYVSNPKELDKAFKQLVELNNDVKDHIDVVAEWHENTVYLYRKDTHEFMGQGSSVDQAMDQVILEKNVEYRIPEEMAKKPQDS